MRFAYRIGVDIAGGSITDVWLLGATLRFWVSELRPPYCYHKWGFYGFGVGPLRFMFWPADGTR